jgi:hypothetical protein
MSSSDTIVTGILATLGIVLVLIIVAVLVANLGIYVCVGMVLFTDAENNPQLMTTLQVFWWIQTSLIILGVISKVCCNPKKEETNGGTVSKVWAIVGILVFIMTHICVALLLFANLGNNQQLMTTLLVLWSIQTAMFGIVFIGGCCLCCFYVYAILNTDAGQQTPLISQDQPRNNPPATV